MGTVRWPLVIVELLTLLALISCGNDLYDEANSGQPQNMKVVTSADKYTNATLADIRAQEAHMSTGDSADFGTGYIEPDIFINLSDEYVPAPANTLVFFYKTYSGDYGKMIITNELLRSDAYLPGSYPSLTISYVTYNATGTMIASGTDQQVGQRWCGDLDATTLQTASGSVDDFQWAIGNDTKRGIKSCHGAKFYRIK